MVTRRDTDFESNRDLPLKTVMTTELVTAAEGITLAEAHQIELKVEDGVYARMASLCTQVDIGARQIDHLLDRTVLPELSRELLAKMTEETMPTMVTMGTNESGEFTYTFSA